MIICSWNINGIKSLLSHNINPLIEQDIDILMVQEVRTGNVNLIYKLAELLRFPYVYYNLSEKTGHAGVATLSKLRPKTRFYPDHIIPSEGRILVLVFDTLTVVNLYTPYIGQDKVNLQKRADWEADIIDFLTQLKSPGKNLIIGGDLNVAPEEVDRYKVAPNQPGCSVKESDMFYTLLKNVNLKDAYRELHESGGYTWGIKESRLRLDYFLVETQEIKDCYPIYNLHTNSYPSDHYPLILKL